MGGCGAALRRRGGAGTPGRSAAAITDFLWDKRTGLAARTVSARCWRASGPRGKMATAGRAGSGVCWGRGEERKRVRTCEVAEVRRPEWRWRIAGPRCVREDLQESWGRPKQAKGMERGWEWFRRRGVRAAPRPEERTDSAGRTRKACDSRHQSWIIRVRKGGEIRL